MLLRNYGIYVGSWDVVVGIVRSQARTRRGVGATKFLSKYFWWIFPHGKEDFARIWPPTSTWWRR